MSHATRVESSQGAPGSQFWTPPVDRGRWGRSAYVVPVALCAAAMLALAIDVPVARWSLDESPFHFLKQLLHVAEPFGHGVGVALIALAVYVLDVRQRRGVLRLLVAAWGAGIAANLVKLLVARARPAYWLRLNQSDVFSTFEGWLPLAMNRSTGQSLPSGHTATAVGLALALSWLYPRGRWMFLGLAALVGLQRISVDAHFVSDVCVGAALGWLVALVALPRAPEPSASEPSINDWPFKRPRRDS